MSQTSGIALLCDSHGNILKTLSDPLGIGAAIQPGMPFARLTAHGGLSKALSFIAEINSQGSAFDWEINIAFDEHIRTLHFTGGKTDNELLIVGAENGRFSLRLYEEMMRMNNEQTNLLRAALKENSRDNQIYDKISRLNNELVAIQRELAKKNAELEHLNQEKNRFLGMAAHDLRNPLNAILNYSSFLLEGDPATLGNDYREFLEVIYSSSEFMTRLVEDLLDVAKIEAGQLNLDFSVVDMVSLVEKNALINKPLAARKQITLEYALDVLPRAMVDSAKLEQVLNNLIGNAIKYSQPEKKIWISLHNQGDHFLISIQDQGPGISVEEQANMFKPFQRGKAKGTAGEKSTGLGLMIVKRIIEGHGGKIWLESKLGEGTTFFLSIPFQPPEKKNTDH